MAKRKNLNVKIDYVSIIFNQATAEEVAGVLLGLDIEMFHARNSKVKYKSYTKVYEIANMKIYTEGIPSKENQSGMGCDDFLNHKKSANAFGYFFRTLDLHFKIRRGGYHLTRLDIAIDDRNNPPYFT